ncbi:MAG TPA: hypothetical protein VK144_02725 [Bacillota bacterium]|nr:hypothetical protein [Bacillota bacterium]
MNHLSDESKYVIEQYQEKERLMIIIFAQWCIDHDFDPVDIYTKAYPKQGKNDQLADVLEEPLEKEKPSSIDIDTLFEVLQLYGNEDLAIVIQEELENRATTSK